MNRKLSTYESEIGKGYCEVHFDFKEEVGFIKYYDNNGKFFYTEEFPNKSINYINDAAENWCSGIKKLHNT